MSARERWPSTYLFIFAAVGSAVGLGNVWRFPYLVGKYGGGAFLFPYLAALFLIGLPLLIMEFYLGQYFQRGAVEAWKNIKNKFSGIGVGQLLTSLGICSYYGVIMGWCTIFLVLSFWTPWVDNTEEFFKNHVLQITENPELVQGFSIPVLLGTIVTWIAVYFCLFKGIRGVSNVVAVTMPLPVILLLVLLVRVTMLPGAGDGLAFYLTPQFDALFDAEVWMAAVSQIFFTLTLGLGVMTTYASYQKRESNLFINAFVTAIADVMIAFVAGLVIFATIGYMSFSGGGSIQDLANSGPGLAFIVFPQALSLIPYSGFFSFIFFLMLLTLGIDSLFSMSEAIAAFFYDCFPKVSKKKVVFFVCLACFLGGLIFTTTAGIHFLDITDHFVTHYALILIGIIECLAFSWVYTPEKMRASLPKGMIPCGRGFDILVKYFIPFILLAILIRSILSDIGQPYENYPLWIIITFGWGWVFFILFSAGAYSWFQNNKDSGA